jgi:4-hydroxy-2-oxoheptanedioate aldolase
MKFNNLKKLLAEGKRTTNGWISIPSSFAAEIYAAQGFESVAIDMQHGAVDVNDVVPLLQAICLSPNVTPMARVPWNNPADIMRVLDAGAMGIICPMINTRKEAEALVQAGRYAPIGARSSGPFRAGHWGGADYFQHANTEILLIAMIETVEAVKNLDEILSVPGLDGVYVGPGDLSITMGQPPSLDPTDKAILAAIAEIAKKTRAKGKIAGVHTDGPKTAAKRYAEGYQFCTLLNDIRVLANAVNAMVKETKGAAAGEASKMY